MDRLESMALLLSVVECGSLSAAGRRQGMPLATVSRKLADLEAHLKTRLLNRSTRRLALTDAGRAYVQACKRILEQVEEAERAAAGEYSAPRGELILSAPLVFGRLHVLPLVTEFLLAYPEVDVRLALSDRIVDLLEDHIDAAIRIGELPDSSLIATRIGAVRRVVCASPGYFAGHGLPLSLEALSEHRCISFERGATPDSWLFRRDGAELRVPVRPRLTVNTAEAAIDAAIAGVGLTRVLSYQVEAARKAGLLQVLPGEFESAPVPVSLVYPSQGRLPQKLRAFIDFTVPRLRERLPALSPA